MAWHKLRSRGSTTLATVVIGVIDIHFIDFGGVAMLYIIFEKIKWRKTSIVTWSCGDKFWLQCTNSEQISVEEAVSQALVKTKEYRPRNWKSITTNNQAYFFRHW